MADHQAARHWGVWALISSSISFNCLFLTAFDVGAILRTLAVFVAKENASRTIQPSERCQAWTCGGQ